MSDPTLEERLDRALDAALHAAPFPEPAPDPALAATLRDLAALRATIPPPGARERVWRQLTHEAAPTQSAAVPAATGRAPLPPALRVAQPTPIVPFRPRRLRALLELAAVAALLLALTGIMVGGNRAGLIARRSATATLAAGSVAMAGGNPARTGVQPGPGPGAAPHVLWRFTAGGMVSAQPVVSAGTVYAASQDGYLYAIDAATGRQRWRFPIQPFSVPSPAVAGDLVYTCGRDNHFHALDAGTGRERWQFQPAGQLCLSSPIIASGEVIFASNARLSDGSDIGYLYALNATSGAERWRLTIHGATISGWAMANGTVYVTADSNVFAFDPASGAQRWRFTTGASLGKPMVSGATVYVSGSTSNLIIALNAATGRARWRAAPPRAQLVGTATASGLVYAAGSDVLTPTAQGNERPVIIALDPQTGAERWHLPVPDTKSPSDAPPAIMDGTLYLGVGDALYAMDALTGAARWYVPLPSAVTSAPAVVGGVVYVGCDDGSVYALGAR